MQKPIFESIRSQSSSFQGPRGASQGYLPQDGYDDEDDGVDLRGLFMTLWHGKWVIAVCTVLALASGILGVSQATPMYRSSAMVMFETAAASKVSNIQDFVVNPEFTKDTLQNEIEVLRSTNLIERVIDKLKLDQNPEFNEDLRAEGNTLVERFLGGFAIPPELTDIAQSIGLAEPPGPAPDPTEVAARQRLAIIENVRSGLSLSPVRGSRVIEIGYTSENPRTAADIVNTIAAQYIVDQLEAKLEATRSATEWLAVRVDELRERVQSAENSVESQRAELTAVSGQSLEITRQQLEALNGSLAVARNNTAALAAKFERLGAVLTNDGNIGAVSDFRQNPLIQTLRTQEADLVSREIALRQTVPDNHPRLVSLRAQIDEIRASISREAERVVASIQLDLEAAVAQEEDLARQVRELEDQAQTQSQAELQIRQLEREAQASRLLYENFLGRLQETSEQGEIQRADARVLSPAEPPNFPLSETKKRVLAFAAVLGLAIGIGIVILLEKLNNTFRSPAQVEEIAGVGVLASVPQIGSKMHREDVVRRLREKPNSSLAEAIRNLRTSILFSNVDNPPKVVMFTSSVPREAKSTTSMLMAMTSRQMGKSAIIVDCDLRLPALAKILKTSDDTPGLLSVMEGTATVEEAVYKDQETGLHVLLTKSREKPSQLNAADILASQKFRALVEDLSAKYDLVILDTPPTVVVTDARIVSKVADAVVYAVRWDDTPRGAVLEGLKELRTVNANVIGVVLTLVNETKAAKYAYQSYGYGYYKGQYKDYYVN
ncbi:MAG: polysaccharide biosynthesis tyrosine autokinase [Roseivivax sp.]|nr:polysaccharide biosynthesis tyrosine autokinase [Roseivivax sp.]